MVDNFTAPYSGLCRRDRGGRNAADQDPELEPPTRSGRNAARGLTASYGMRENTERSVLFQLVIVNYNE